MVFAPQNCFFGLIRKVEKRQRKDKGNIFIVLHVFSGCIPPGKYKENILHIPQIFSGGILWEYLPVFSQYYPGEYRVLHAVYQTLPTFADILLQSIFRILVYILGIFRAQNFSRIFRIF